MNEQIENVVEVCDETQGFVTTTPNKSGLTKVGIGLAVAGLVGLGIHLIKKNKHKIEENRIKKLEKKGYVVLPPTDEATDDFDKLIDSVK